MRLFLSLAALSLVSCTTAPPSTYVAPPVVDGCTIDVEMPVCSVDRPRPYFAPGAHSGDLTIAYEAVKGELLRSEGCIEAMNNAVAQWRLACSNEQVTRVRTR
jgi:hypothetical protein